MMKKFAYLFSAAALMFTLAGCASVEIVKGAKLNGQKFAKQGETIAHVNVQNNGFYLFSIPLFTGDTKSVGSIAFFKNTVCADRVAELLASEAKKLGGKEVKTANSQYSEFGFIFYSRTVNMSGNVIK